VTALESPGSVAERAEGLGMVPATAPLFLRLPDGAILGAPPEGPEGAADRDALDALESDGELVAGTASQRSAHGADAEGTPAEDDAGGSAGESTGSAADEGANDSTDDASADHDATGAAGTDGPTDDLEDASP
jgi:hypothetical protein